MRRVIYSTGEVKTPKFFANMCNITGTEEIAPIEFSDYVVENYGKDLEDLSDEEYDTYFQEYREYVESNSGEVNEVEVSDADVSGASLDVNLEATIDMKSDGSWDFVDTSWAECAETSDGSWYTTDNTLVATSQDLIEDVTSLIQLYLPIEEGTFDLTGNVHLMFVDNDGELVFDMIGSSVDDFNFTKAR